MVITRITHFFLNICSYNNCPRLIITSSNTKQSPPLDIKKNSLVLMRIYKIIWVASLTVSLDFTSSIKRSILCLII